MNKVTVNDVGPRDGLQNDPTQVDPNDRVRIINALVAAGITSVEAASFVSPKAVPKMAGADKVFENLDTNKADFSALIPNKKGYELAQKAGARSVGVVLSATETMNQKNINMSLDKATQVCQEVLTQASKDGLVARAYVAVAVECPFEGMVEPEQIEHLTGLMFSSGAQEVIIADTIGAANPAQVKALFSRLISKFSADRLSAHFHDTRAMALANTWQALECGIRKFDSSIGGLGGCPFAPGAAGNLATEDLAFMLEQSGYDTGIDMKKLLEAVSLVEELVKHPVGGRTLAYLKRKAA